MGKNWDNFFPKKSKKTAEFLIWLVLDRIVMIGIGFYIVGIVRIVTFVAVFITKSEKLRAKMKKHKEHCKLLVAGLFYPSLLSS